MMDLVLLTSSELPNLHEDEARLPELLRKLGVKVSIEAWDKWIPKPNQTAVIRSIWDYHTRYPEFLDFIGKMEESDVKVWNSPAVLRWNSHKSYLLGLADLGISVVPTQMLYKESEITIGDDKLVVKPAVSASAHQTKVFSKSNPEAAFEILKKNPRGILVQPFIEEIQKEGEWSLTFLNNKFSHATVKVPKAGDFRVQEEHGAKVQVAEAPTDVLKACDRILKRLNKRLLYARVDGVRVRGEFLLMELELIEPSLFFLESETRLYDFAKCIQSVLA
jgi:glutathione synthase/RimK-type ligase-like ATP-grasp enzyme